MSRWRVLDERDGTRRGRSEDRSGLDRAPWENGLMTAARTSLPVTETAGFGTDPVVRAEEVSKVYGQGRLAFTALAPCSISLRAGELVVVLGPSGSGKSTLLHLLSTLDHPTTGRVWFGSRRVDNMGERELARLRARQIGFVLQR